MLAFALAALVVMTAMTAFAEADKNMNRTYGAMPLNHGHFVTADGEAVAEAIK